MSAPAQVKLNFNPATVSIALQTGERLANTDIVQMFGAQPVEGLA
jgi:hypothetical protein